MASYSLTLNFNSAEWKEIILAGTEGSGDFDALEAWGRKALLDSGLQARLTRRAPVDEELAEWWKLTAGSAVEDEKVTSHQAMMRTMHAAYDGSDLLIFREIAVLMAMLRSRLSPDALRAAQNAADAQEWALAVKLVISSVAQQEILVSEAEFMSIMWLMRQLTVELPGTFRVAPGSIGQPSGATHND